MFTVLPVFRSRLRMNRALQAGVLFVLIVRGLLSGAVMFDVHAPSGGFGLVLCSGSGAMFASVANADTTARDDHAAMSTMSMFMPMSMSMLSPHGATLTDNAADGAAHHPLATSTHTRLAATAGMDSGICAFSAALSAAIIMLAGLGLRLPARIHRLIRSPRAWRSITRPTAYRFARSRAPPSRSIMP